MKRLACLVAVLVGWGASFSASARAEGPPSTDAAAAQLFFERGRDAASRGDAAAACQNFEESLRLDLAVGTLFNLARCEQDLGRLASAWQHLREGIDRLEEHDPRRAPALAAADELEPRVPRLEVRLANQAEGRVFRDGVELANLSLGTALPVNPGVHTVTVKKAGHVDAKYTIELAEGASRTIDVAPGPPDVHSNETPPARGGALRTAGWIAGGVGVASLGVGLVTGAFALERSNVAHAHCDSSGACDQRGLDALDASKNLGALSTATVAVGAGLLVGGLLLVVLGKPSASATARPAVVQF